MSDTRAVTAELADWIHGLGAPGAPVMPASVAGQVRRLVLDFLAAAIAGTDTVAAVATRELVAEMYPGDAATVLGGGRASVAGAALANGTAAHALDIDDGYTPGSVHPSAPTLPAVLAAAQALGADGPTTLRAAAVAVEVTCRLAAAGHPATRDAGFHNTAIAGVFGASAGVGLLLGLDAEQTRSALGLAGSHAGGLFEFLGSGAEVKRVHAGKAARDGVISAYLARAGVTGPDTVLEGPNGYFHAFARDHWNPATVLDGLGEDWLLERTYVKIYPCCRHGHAAVDAILDLRGEHALAPDQIDEIRVDTYDVAARHGHTDVATLIDAQMSLPYAVAVALADGEIGLRQFDAAHRTNPELVDLVSRVRVTSDAELDARYPRSRPARVTVRRRGAGDAPDLVALVDQPLGEPSRPVDDVQLTAKFHRLAEPVLGADAARRVVDRVWAFDDVLGLMSALQAAPAPATDLPPTTVPAAPVARKRITTQESA
ncbi:2-methylcitrate dehydratase [Frankia canadensis]|uniref:2-methylcitrate dehydratase n=1 Tax=Frankia canadensis TaxID=1836972 RepID=A0A2I2KV51_9ACTN|nr:MmgE/PrpD family protein [Frankia canadensis]SNQ49530.1 2-methylcitrate dehydratase [Frankia canadensis]SOU56820.1 2-methylcitrate dehydratase [Frankia canadensis]